MTGRGAICAGDSLYEMSVCTGVSSQLLLASDDTYTEGGVAVLY